MSLVAHALIALGYAVFAVGGAVGIAARLPGLDAAAAAAPGACTALAAPLVHLGRLTWRSDTALRRRSVTFHADHAQLARELQRPPAEHRPVMRALDPAGPARRGLHTTHGAARTDGDSRTE